jgi:hypothetical protein
VDTLRHNLSAGLELAPLYVRYRNHGPWDWSLDTPSGTMSEASQKAAMKLCDGNSETHLMQGDATWQKQFETLRRQLEQRWVAQPTKERRVIQSGIIEGKLFSIFDDGSIEIQTGSGIKQFKDFAELRAVAAANGQEGTGRTSRGGTAFNTRRCMI